jgi:hypothetical protein
MSDSHGHLTRVAAERWRLALLLTALMTAIYVGFILLVAYNKPLLGTILMPGLSVGIVLGRAGHHHGLGPDPDLRALDQYPLRPSRRRRASGQAGRPLMQTGETNVVAIAGFSLFIGLSLVITWFAARRTRSTEHFYAAGRSITAFQNGLALAGDYMSAASFLGIAGLVATSGFDGLIYSIGFLVGWPVVVCLIAEPLRNLGKFTFSDVVAFRLRQAPVRVAAAAAASRWSRST